MNLGQTKLELIVCPTPRAVDTSTTPKVQYTYADGTTNTIRQTGLTYPDGRVSNFDYGSAGAVNDRLGRVESIKEGSTALAAYQYLGLSGVVQVDYTQPDLRYDLATGGGDDPYDGLDRFGRVIDCLWRDYGSSNNAERIKYGYDRVSNRTWREVPLDPNDAHDECYGYDGIYRLSSFERGSLNAQKTAISTLKFAQGWNLDATGNWSDFTQDDDGGGTWDLNQQRTTNKANEITAIAETAGPTWADPSYNRVGNMTTIPKPADPTSTFSATYDAWNRLVKLTDGSNTIAEYSYDARHFRTLAKNYTAGVLSETLHSYYTTGWRLLEERLNTSQEPQQQYLWGLRYIDDLILRDRDISDPADGTLNERLYALQDDNWNVTAIADVNGDVVERYAYEAYGWAKSLNKFFETTEDQKLGWNYKYCGYWYVCGTHLAMVRRRQLNLNIGNWLQRDFIEDWCSNLYGYGDGDPLNTIDPLGLRIIKVKKVQRIKFDDKYTGILDSQGQIVAIREEGRHNCLGFATRQGASLRPVDSRSANIQGFQVKKGTSVQDVLDALGYTCTRGISADQCSKHCDCDYIMIYIYIRVPYQLPNESDDAYRQRAATYLKEQSNRHAGKNLLGDSIDDAYVAGLDYHAIQGQPDGSYRFQPKMQKDLEINEFRPGDKKKDYTFKFAEELLDKACCCKSPAK